MVKRNLDSVFFRVKTENGFGNVCFSDMTEEQQEEVMEGRSEEWLRSMCKILAQRLRQIGDELDLVAEYDE